MRPASRSICRWLVLVLASLLSIGHACEPALADVVAHVHGAAHTSPDHHHSPDHNSDEDQASCDAIVAAASSASMSLDPGPGSDAAGSLPIMGQLSVPVAVAAPQESGPPSRRLPLFLLHASFLI